MPRTYAAQKGALTRALRTPDPAKRAAAVVAECRRVVIEWATLPYGWPDDWARWNRALSDVFPWPNAAPDLHDIESVVL